MAHKKTYILARPIAAANGKILNYAKEIVSGEQIESIRAEHGPTPVYVLALNEGVKEYQHRETSRGRLTLN